MDVEEKDVEYYEFGNFRLEPGAFRLLCCGSVVRLSPKSFDLLLLFVQKRGLLLTKEFLMSELWGEQFVEENNLTVRISELRKALGEGRRENAFIQTVFSRGYRFVAKVKVRMFSHDMKLCE